MENNGGQFQENVAAISNGKLSSASSTATKIPTTCTNTSTAVSPAIFKQSMVPLPSTQSSVANSGSTNVRKHSPTISNLLVPSTSTHTAASNGVPIKAMAIPSPVSSTSSISSISMPSRLGSSTPPVVSSGISAISSHTLTTSTAAAVSSTPSQPVPLTIAQTPQPALVGICQPMAPTSNAPPLLPSPSMPIPSALNGSSIPPLMSLSGLPLSPLNAPPYRSVYPAYGLYPTYGLHPHPYGIPATPIPSPAVSPRTIEARRESNLVLSKPIRPMTPNSNVNTPTSQTNHNNTSLVGPNAFQLSSNSPRGFSPPKERDNFR